MERIAAAIARWSNPIMDSKIKSDLKNQCCSNIGKVKELDCLLPTVGNLKELFEIKDQYLK